jgi:hypothetical protein
MSIKLGQFGMSGGVGVAPLNPINDLSVTIPKNT